MADDPASNLFEFATSKRAPRTNEEETLMELHAALGMSKPPSSVMYSPTVRRQSDMRRYFQIAIAAALIVALVGTSFRFLNLAPDTNQSTIPPVVLGLASPELSANAACGGTRSLPVISGATAAPEGMSALLLTPAGDLILDCEGDQELLESSVTSVTAMSWPGVVLLGTEAGSTYLNIFTDDSFVVGDTTLLDAPGSPLMVYSQRSTNQLTIVPASDDPANAAVLNLNTLEATDLIDSNGNPIPISRIPVIGSNDQGTCMVVAYSVRVPSNNSDYLGGFVAVNGDGQTTSIAAAAIQDPTPRELAVSPDCETIASVSFQGQQQAGTTTLTIQSRNGEGEAIRFPAETPDWPTQITWLQSGDGIVFASGENLLLWNEPFADTEPATLAQGITIDDINLTRDPNVIVVSAMDWTPESGQSPERTLIIDTTTQNITEVESTDMYLGVGIQPHTRNTLLMRTAPTTIYDATTGDLLGELGNNEVTQPNLILVQPDPFGSAEIGLAGTSFDDLWRILGSNGEPMMEKIAPPADLGDITITNGAMSTDGLVFVAPSFEAETGWLKNADDPSGDWIAITFDPAATVTTVQFVNRADATSQRTPQVSKPSPAASAQCFDNGDPLLFFGHDFPIDFPTLLITGDGTLKFRCSAPDDTVVVDTDVVWVDTTAVPGTIIVNKLAEKSTAGQIEPAVTTSILNLRTGERLDLGVNLEGTIFRQDEHSPWYVASSPDELGEIIVVDLRTLATHTILAADSDSTATGAIVSSSNDSSITAIALVTQGSLSGGGGLVVGRSDEQPEILVLHDTFDQGVWMPITSPNGPVDDLLFSPDGAYLALEVVDGLNTYGIKHAIQYIVIDPATGDALAQSEVAGDISISDKAWGLDSSRFIYTSGNDLSVLEPAASAEPRLVLTAPGGVEGLMLTPDPEIVIVNVRTPRQDPIATSNRVSLVSGEMEILGVASPVPFYPVEKITPMISTFDGTTIRFMDAATGEILVESTAETDFEGAATPTGTDATVNLYLQSPVFTGIDTDDFRIWIWGADLQVRSLSAPSEPEDQFRYAGITTDDGRFIVLLNYRFYAADGTPIDPSSSGPAEVIYLLDTQAEEPVWIPVN